MALDHAQNLRIGQKGASATPGIQLVTLASLPEVAFRGQLVYALDLDEFRVFDGDAWQVPTAATSGGTQTFVGPTEPVADAIGDLWMKNTTYQLYIWDGTIWREVQDPTADAAASAASAAQADAITALTAANNAQATADGKVETFYQSSAPVTGVENPSIGDLWFRTSDNRAFIYDGTTPWVEIQDQSIVTALDNAGTAQATADQKISSYYQTTPPWPDGTAGHGNDIGDLWFDTDDNNKPYRWDGNWTTIRDGSIATASASAATALAAANAAQTAADTAQATADGAIRTFYQSAAPTGLNSTTNVGDLWFDTDDGQAYRWNGTAFVIIEDNSIAAALAAAQNAQTTADGKITAYYQTTAPTIAETGDLWYDTDDKNKPYFCSAAGPPAVWTVVRDATIADAQSAADAAAADAAAAQSRFPITETDISDGAISTPKLAADAIDGMTITGALIRTSATGTRVELGHLTDPARLDEVTFFSGHADSPTPGRIEVSGETGFAQLVTNPPIVTGAPHNPGLNLWSSDVDNGYDVYAYKFTAEDPRGGLVVAEGGAVYCDSARVAVLPQVLTASCSSNVSLTTTEVDITGATVTFTTLRPNAKYICTGSFYYASTGTATVASGKLNVDGTNRAAFANFTGINTTPDRVNSSQTWTGTLASAGSHTLKLRGVAGASTVTVNATHTTINVLVFE